MTVTSRDQLLMRCITKDCLTRMAEDPEIWLPSSSTKIDPTGQLDFWICITFDDVDDEVMERRLDNELAYQAERTDMPDPHMVEVPPDLEDPVVTTNVTVNDTEPYTRVTEITAKHYAPEAKWHEKDWLAKLERESEQSWQKLSDEDRQAMIVITKDCLRRMAEDPHVWLPSSMVAKTGNKMDLWICINFDDVDDEVIRRRTEAEKALLATQADLKEMEKALRPDSPEVAAQKEKVAQAEEVIRRGEYVPIPGVTDATTTR